MIVTIYDNSYELWLLLPSILKNQEETNRIIIEHVFFSVFYRLLYYSIIYTIILSFMLYTQLFWVQLYIYIY